MAWHGKQKKSSFPPYGRFFMPGIARKAFICMVAVLLSSAGLPAVAQDREGDEKPIETESKLPDRENGLLLAHKLCTSCHLTGGEPADASAPADVPSFPSIADRPNQSAQTLANWLLVPHAPMPDPHLTRKEIRDVAAYILSLRTAD